jgi:hypothetical protein
MPCRVASAGVPRIGKVPRRQGLSARLAPDLSTSRCRDLPRPWCPSAPGAAARRPRDRMVRRARSPEAHQRSPCDPRRDARICRTFPQG